MSIGSTIVGLVLFLAMISPIIILNWNKKRKKNKLESSLMEQCSKVGLTIDDKEFWRNTVIACDKVNKAVAYACSDESESHIEIVKLSEIERCEPVTVSSAVSTSKGEHNVIDKIFLKLIYKSSTKPDLCLVFYDSNMALQLDNDQMRIIEWNRKINALIKQCKTLNR